MISRFYLGINECECIATVATIKRQNILLNWDGKDRLIQLLTQLSSSIFDQLGNIVW